MLQSFLVHVQPRVKATCLAVLVLRTVALQREAGGRVCGVTLQAVGNASPPSTISPLGDSLIFVGSWLGHSNVVSYSFQEPDVPAAANAVLPATASKAAGDQAASDAREVQIASAAAKQETPEAGALTDGAAVALGLEGTAMGAQQVEPSTGEVGGFHRAVMDAAAAAAVTPVTRQPSAVGPEMLAAASSGLDALVEQMKNPGGETPRWDDPTALGREPVLFGVTQGDAENTGTEAADSAAGTRLTTGAKRSFEEVEAPNLRDLIAAEGESTPAAKVPRLDEALSSIMSAIEAASPKAGGVPGLPVGGAVSDAVPGIGIVPGMVPGLGQLGTPGRASEASKALTEGPEVPLEEGNPSASEDDENLEASLY